LAELDRLISPPLHTAAFPHRCRRRPRV